VPCFIALPALLMLIGNKTPPPRFAALLGFLVATFWIVWLFWHQHRSVRHLPAAPPVRPRLGGPLFMRRTAMAARTRPLLIGLLVFGIVSVFAVAATV
jgi:hypothetical protein